MIKLTAPGVPDIYQGCEALDFSLVDPDNRREPDFVQLTEQLDIHSAPDFTCQQDWLSGRLKQHIARILHLRRDHPQLLRFGDYQPLNVTGEHSEKLVAFALQDSESALLVIAPRLIFTDAQWTHTTVALNESLAHRQYRNVLNGETYTITDSIALDNVSYSAPLILISR